MRNGLLKISLFVIILLPLFAWSQNKLTRIESIQSLFLELYYKDTRLGTATGFVIRSETQNYLVTNYHVVTNKRPDNGEWLNPKIPISPDMVKIQFLSKDTTENMIEIEERLLDKNGQPLWYENEIGNEKVDVVELPLKDTTRVEIFPVNYKTSAYDNVLITPTERVFILGFPLGLRSDHDLPIWKSGLIASEPDFNQEGKPIIWIDAETFQGMSGAPVYFMSKGMVTLKDGKSAIISGPSKFMGVFSHKLPVYGALWKASYLKDIFDKLP